MILTTALNVVEAQGQELPVSDVQNSGCVDEARGGKSQRTPTIILEKEGSVLSVQLLNYESDCCTEEFKVTSSISGGNDGAPSSVSINAVPVDGGCDCICPYNVSFTVRNLEPNSFYLDCWWYKGQVELTEGQSYQAVKGGSFHSLSITLLSDSKEWTTVHLGALPPKYQHTFSYEQIKLGSALEVDGMTFKQIVSSSWWYDQDGPSNWKETDDYLGEADGKVYLYNQKSQNTVQIMDFTLKVGDTYRQMLTGGPNDDYMDFVVTAVTDTVIATSVDKTPRKCLYLSRAGSTNIDDVWVEGIGSLVGGVYGAYVQLMVGAIPSLRSCQENGKALYEAYHPFLKEGKTWNYQYYYRNLRNGEEEEWSKDISYVVNGTTEIDGKTYYKMYRVSEEGSEYYCALREEDRKVWMRTDNGGERMLYDFGMSVGGCYMPYDEWNTLQLVAISPMRFKDEILNVFHYDVSVNYFFLESFEVFPYSVVEGVGCDKGWNILELFYSVPSNGIIMREDFLSCYEDGKCIFTADDFNDLPTTEPENDYIPFVASDKSWYVVRSDLETGCHIEHYKLTNEEVVKDGKTYMKMYRSEDDLSEVHDAGLLREENRKVYRYDTDRGEENLLFDYSLKAGDTYETYSYDEQKKVTYKVLSVSDYREGPEVIRNSEETGGMTTQHRYLRKWTICRTDDETFQKTWIEGVGSLEGPLENLLDIVLPDLSKDYLAYVYDKNSGLYLPFSFQDTWFRQAYGCNLPTGTEDNFVDDGYHKLTYELEGDRLHVYGEAFTYCTPKNYAYFFEQKTDDPQVNKIEFIIEVAKPVSCMALHATDFYVPGFDPNLNYIVVDNNGEEHPVIKKTAQDDYIPFVASGKSWHVARSEYDQDSYGIVCHIENYTLTDEEEIVKDGKTYMKMYRTEDESTVVHDAGLFREENRKVYRYDTDRGEENLLFDYSLKAGDTYETYSYDEQKKVTYKVLSVSDYQEGPEVINYIGTDGITMQPHYLRKWTICRTDNEAFQKTWIEGVGSLEGPLGNLIDIVLPDISVDHLAYVDNPYDGLYLPFSFQDTWLRQAYGCDLPTGAADHSGNWDHQLTYELEGDRLHVYGKVLSNCGGNSYALFIMEPNYDLSDESSVRKLHFEIQTAEPIATCMALYETDFYIPGFDPNLNYIVVDNQGKEHPVIKKTPQVAYRPLVEEGKVWKVGNGNTGNPVQIVDYYYFDGDTIIGGKTCKQMMCQRFVSPDYSNEYWKPKTSLSKVGAWYEEDQKVYVCREGTQGMQMLYDFSLEANDTLILNDYQPDYIVGPKLTGGLNGFKGVYRDIMLCGGDYYITTWLEGVGGIDGPLRNVYPETESDPQFLMSCSVGDEVIYLNDEYEDGATPEGARKSRFDFTHTIKTRPKAPGKNVVGHAIPADAPTHSLSQRDNDEPGEEASGTEALYGKYNALQLDINLDPLDDAYQVSITDGSGKAVYEKAVNTGTVVALSIDISSYAKGRYTVTVENSEESFTGQFEAQTTKMRLGDLNGDGAVDVADIATVISVMANGVESANVNGDVNGDGVVDVADISTIITIMAALLNNAD